MSIPPSFPLLLSVRTYVVAPKCKCTHTHDVGSLLAKVLGTIYLTSFLYPLHTLNRSKQKSSFYGSKYYAFYCRVANYLVHLSKYAWRKSVSEYLDAIAMVWVDFFLFLAWVVWCGMWIWWLVRIRGGEEAGRAPPPSPLLPPRPHLLKLHCSNCHRMSYTRSSLKCIQCIATRQNCWSYVHPQ